MKGIVFIFAIMVLFASPALSATHEDMKNITKDQKFNKMIVGKWAEDGEVYGIAYFEEGGNYEAWLYENSKKEKLLHTIKGKWWIKDGTLYNSVSEISPPVPGLNSSEIVIDKIVEINEDSMTLIDDEFNQYTKIKIKDAQESNPKPEKTSKTAK